MDYYYYNGLSGLGTQYNNFSINSKWSFSSLRLYTNTFLLLQYKNCVKWYFYILQKLNNYHDGNCNSASNDSSLVRYMPASSSWKYRCCITNSTPCFNAACRQYSKEKWYSMIHGHKHLYCCSHLLLVNNTLCDTF